MASMLHKVPFQPLTTPFTRSSLPAHISFFPQKPHLKSKIPSSLSPSHQSSLTPPTSKEQAILQAKTCISLSLQKPLTNPRLAGKLKKLSQPRFRVEVPIIDESPESLTQLSLQLFSDLPLKTKAPPVKLLILWPTPSLSKLANSVFESQTKSPSLISVHNSDLSTVSTNTNRISSADVVVFFGPEVAQLKEMRSVGVESGFYPKPLLLFNPKWGFEEESGFGELSGFVGSFEVVYAFMGLEVRGVLSRKRGVVFKSGREEWVVLVEESGEMKVISRFKKRPSLGEVENVLYNVMAANSPVTKSLRFVRDLMSNVTGRKQR